MNFRAETVDFRCVSLTGRKIIATGPFEFIFHERSGHGHCDRGQWSNWLDFDFGALETDQNSNVTKILVNFSKKFE